MTLVEECIGGMCVAVLRAHHFDRVDSCARLLRAEPLPPRPPQNVSSRRRARLVKAFTRGLGVKLCVEAAPDIVQVAALTQPFREPTLRVVSQRFCA